MKVSGLRALLAILALPLVVALPRAAHAQLEVDQLEIFFRTGDSANATFSVRNVSGGALTATIALGDWDRSEDGSNRFLASGSLRSSCNPHVAVFPSTLRLEAGASQTVRVAMNGAAISAACWSSVIVESAAVPTQSPDGARLLLQIRTAVKIYGEPAGARASLEILDLDLRPHLMRGGDQPSDTSAMDVYLRVTNPGGIQARVKGRVEIRSLADSLVARTEMEEFPILPGAFRAARSRLPVLPAGRYVALVLLDYGGTELIAGQIELDIRS